MTILVLEEARLDIDEGRDFYDECEYGVGEYFVETIYGEIFRLEHPAGLHPVRFGFHRLLSHIFPFGVYYLLEDETVKVCAVLDLRRDPPFLDERLNSRQLLRNDR